MSFYEPRTLVNRLKGIYTTDVNDGGGPLNGSKTFTRNFQVPPISLEAAKRIEDLEAELELLKRAVVQLAGGSYGHENDNRGMGQEIC